MANQNFQHHYSNHDEWMMHLYRTLLCIVEHPKHFTIMWGGSLLNHHQCAASTWMIRRLPQDNGASALTTHRLQVERRERVIEPIKCVRSPHTSYRWRGEREIEPIKCVRSPHTSYRWRGERVIEPIKCVRSPHTSYRWRGERVIEPIKWMGIIRRPWLIRASGGNLAWTPGLHHYSLQDVPWDF